MMIVVQKSHYCCRIRLRMVRFWCYGFFAYVLGRLLPGASPMHRWLQLKTFSVLPYKTFRELYLGLGINLSLKVLSVTIIIMALSITIDLFLMKPLVFGALFYYYYTSATFHYGIRDGDFRCWILYQTPNADLARTIDSFGLLVLLWQVKL